jgi:predicted peptidase
MSHLIKHAALLLSLVATSFVHADQTAEKWQEKVVLDASYGFLQSLPEGYASDPQKRWPLIVFLHGSGERGTDLEALKKHGPPKLIAAGKNIPAIVASPQCPNGQIWDPHAVHALTQHLIKTLRVDADRVYLTGLSMGGFGTWDTAMEYPKTYAALIPICGGAGVRFVMADRIRQIPIWIFHGEKDSVVDPAFSKSMKKVLEKLGANVQLTLYPEASHDSWTATYDNPEVWDWLFKQKR